MKLRSVIFLTIFLIGVAPLLSLVAINLRGHIQRHEEVEHKRLLANSKLIAGKLLNSIKYLGRDPSDLIPEYKDSWWINEDGSYLHIPDNFLPTKADQAEKLLRKSAFNDFDGLELMIKTGEPFVWKDNYSPTIISWIPVSAGEKIPSDLWIGQIIDTSSAKAWQHSLIKNIAIIAIVTMMVLFFIAQLIAAKVDSLRKDILVGLKKTLNDEEEVLFNWRGPQEIKTLAQDLTALCNQYIRSRRESLNAENQLRESENRFRKLTSSAQDPIIMMDSNGDVAFWNKAAENTFGYKTDEAMGKSVHTLLDLRRTEQPLMERQPPLQKSIKEKSSAANETIELTARRQDGEEIHIELSLSAARIKKQWHAIWIARDITAKKKAEEEAKIREKQLIEADKMYSLGLLVSGVAHEINNPNSITILNSAMLSNCWKSITPILEEYYQDNGDFVVNGLEYSEMRKQIPRLFDELEESGQRVKNIVKDLKDYSRQEPSKSSLDVDLNEAISTAVRLTSNQIKKSTNNFKMETAPDLPPLKGSVQRLEQVIINLIQNACEAIENKNSAIKISSAYLETEKKIYLIVEDEGKGVPAKEINHLTDPFFTTKRDQGGTGLGLSVSAGIVTQHNGTINFASSPGKGTKVTVAFQV